MNVVSFIKNVMTVHCFTILMKKVCVRYLLVIISYFLPLSGDMDREVNREGCNHFSLCNVSPFAFLSGNFSLFAMLLLL